MQKRINVAVSTNERYVLGAIQALAGVAVHAQASTDICFHIFTENVCEASFDFIKKTLLRLHSRSTVIQHICDEKLLEGLPYWAGSRMAAIRCFYAELMPEVDWCLYLDCDVLYFASVEEHFSYCDDQVYACVVQEESKETRRQECQWIYENCGVKILDENYFNSGVMLFNFKKMREDNVPSMLLNFFKKNKNIPSPDQDALNTLFVGKTKMLPKKFDYLQIFLTDEKLKEKPVIHYVSGNPWLPTLGEVESRRFKLWHTFADKYIWQVNGMSYRKCFTKKIILCKRISYWALKIPFLHYLFCFLLRLVGFKGATKRWRDAQVRYDISMKEVPWR